MSHLSKFLKKTFFFKAFLKKKHEIVNAAAQLIKEFP